MTIEVLREIGVSVEGLRSKPVTEFLGKAPVRHVIIVCDRAQAACPRIYPFAGQMHSWPFEDPAAFEGDAAGTLAKFREIRDRIGARIAQWLAEEPAVHPLGA